MDDPFSTPQRPPIIRDFVPISKTTFIALLQELPFQELHLQSRCITDEEDTSATISFIQELGRALSNVHITPSASKTPSPKKLLTGTLDRPNTTLTLPSEEDTPSKPRHKPDPPPSTTATPSILSSQTSQIVTRRRFPTTEEELVTWKRRQEMMKLAMDVDSSTPGISSEIDTIPTRVEQVDDTHAGTIIPDFVLENVEWDHPPNFPGRPADDPVVKELLLLRHHQKARPFQNRGRRKL
jgi:hypothetical protein